MRDRLSSALLGAIVLIGCIAGNAQAASEAKKNAAADFGPPDPPSAETAPSDYRIGPMDKLSVSVIQLPDLPKDQQVDGAGNICVATLMTGHITVISPEGKILDQVKMPDIYPTNICFGGPDMRTAYISLSASGQLG